MKSQPDYIWLLAALLFFYVGYKQFYLARNVDAFQRAGRLTTETAERIRRKPMRLIGSMAIIGGLAFVLLAFVRL